MAERRPSLQESSGSSSLLQTVKRTISTHRPRAPSIIRKALSSASCSPAPSGTVTPSTTGTDTPNQSRPYSIAPPSHRENTAWHAVINSLPTLPSFRAPSLPNVSMPSWTPFGGGGRPNASSDDEDALGSSSATGAVSQDKDDPLKRLSGPVVTLGGYRGSILRDAKTNKRIWIPMKVGFLMRKVDLAMGLDDEDELRSTETIVPGRQLMQVGPIDLGKRLKDKLKALSAAQSPLNNPSLPPSPHPIAPLQFVNHGYDWRRSLSLSSAELLARLEQLKAESAARGEGADGKGEGATVIAHSMGGLVTLHALAKASDPTVFKGIIFAGTPFHGCVNVLSPLRNGDGVLFNREICSPSVVFSMRSSFYFLPFSGLCFEDPSGTPLPIDFFDPHSWSDYGLSPIALGLFEESGEKRERQRRLAREEAEKAESGIGAPVLGEGNLGERGMGRKVSRGIEEALQGVRGEGESGGQTPARRNSIPLGEAEGEVEIDGLPVTDDSHISDSPLNLSSLQLEESAVDLSLDPESSETDRQASTNSTASSPSSSPAGTPAAAHKHKSRKHQQQRTTRGGSSGSASSSYGDNDKPEFPSLDKVLSASDQTLATYLVRTLERVKEFHADFENLYDPAKAAAGLYPPLVLLTSRKTPTVRGVIAKSREGIKSDPYEELLWDEGDGIVLYSSASSLPGGPDRWNKHLKGVVESSFGHVSLVGDVENIRKCLVELYD